MRVFEINSVYPAYIKSFYKRNPNTEGLSYAEHKKLVDAEGNGGAGPYAAFLPQYGIELSNCYINLFPLQQIWAHENGLKDSTQEEIAIRQVQAFAPDILWYSHYDEALLDRIRERVPSIKKVICWVGSAIPRTQVWKKIDLILSCAPEVVTHFEKEGLKAKSLHHAFDTRVLEKLQYTPQQYKLIFIGQLIKAAGFHNIREEMLERLAAELDITVFSPITDQLTFKRKLISELERWVSGSVKTLGKMNWAKTLLYQNEELKRIYEKNVIDWSLSTTLSNVIKPPVFGLEMYQSIQQSEMVLNIHADSSPLYASNMRLWETTGVGACLITDWKQNLHELFKADEEVVVYKDVEECIEKVRWLVNNPAKMKTIAEAGHQKCLTTHTYQQRVEELVPMLRQLMTV